MKTEAGPRPIGQINEGLTSMKYVVQPKELGVLCLQKRDRGHVCCHMQEGLALLWVALEGTAVFEERLQ